MVRFITGHAFIRRHQHILYPRISPLRTGYLDHEEDEKRRKGRRKKEDSWTKVVKRRRRTKLEDSDRTKFSDYEEYYYCTLCVYEIYVCVCVCERLRDYY